MNKTKLQSAMCASGRPYSDPKVSAEYAKIFRAALKLGMTDKQAFALTRTAYDGAQGYDWKITDVHIHRATIEANAKKYPHGKCAEDLRAEKEGRPSRWGTNDLTVFSFPSMKE